MAVRGMDLLAMALKWGDSVCGKSCKVLHALADYNAFVATVRKRAKGFILRSIIPGADWLNFAK